MTIWMNVTATLVAAVQDVDASESLDALVVVSVCAVVVLCLSSLKWGSIRIEKIAPRAGYCFEQR